MHYVDTSAFAEVLLNDPERAVVEALLEALQQDGLCSSRWTQVEIFSAISRRVRDGRLGVGAAERVRQLYANEISRQVELLPITPDCFSLAASWLAQASLGLRAADALHLATASVHKIDSFLTLDRKLRTIAATLGFKTPTP
ncbi:MAG: type II toxin-antitoxin system VapC family toxin [Gammaproteobacteria bacterium]|nr:type II toxin-antitoxin system VapC family toxin [Gammaproteobacteria bacterium]